MEAWGESGYDMWGGGWSFDPSYFAGVSGGVTIPGNGATSGGGTATTVIPGVNVALNLGNLNQAGHALSQDPKVLATAVVDQAEPILRANLEAYMAGERTLSRQQTALDTFDTVWARVVEELSNPALGQAGRNGIIDRKSVRDGGNGKWDWFAYYRDPIADDSVKTDLAGLPAMLTNLGGSTLLYLAIGLVGLLALWKWKRRG